MKLIGVKGSKSLEEVNMDLERGSETVVPFWNHTRLSEQLKEVVDQMQNRSRQQAGHLDIFWPFSVTKFCLAGRDPHPCAWMFFVAIFVTIFFSRQGPRPTRLAPATLPPSLPSLADSS